mmetsp:Transcript_2416/g.9373  ORF Transcript_2416/g.9373 Transcript_2416/m.9373 type:complete len:272 (+) Transcript_2416:215-1030(+)
MVGRMIAAVFDKRRVHQPPYALIASLILTQPYFLLSHSWSTSAFRTRPAVAPAEALPKYDDVFDDDVFVGELLPPEEVLDSLAAGASLVGFLNWFSNGPFTAYGRGRPLFVMCRLFASPLCFRKRIKFSSPSSSHRYTHANTTNTRLNIHVPTTLWFRRLSFTRLFRNHVVTATGSRPSCVASRCSVLQSGFGSSSYTPSRIKSCLVVTPPCFFVSLRVSCKNALFRMRAPGEVTSSIVPDVPGFRVCGAGCTGLGGARDHGTHTPRRLAD